MQYYLCLSGVRNGVIHFSSEIVLFAAVTCNGAGIISIILNGYPEELHFFSNAFHRF